MDIDKIIEPFNDEKTACMFDYNDVQQNKIAAVVPYLIPFLFFLPLIMDKNSAFCKFHANQQLTWFLVILVIGIVKSIIGIIPLIGWLVRCVIEIAELLVALCFMYGASKGKALRLPFVGELIKIF
ncbi:MAG: DUF4870 domain-containing protein [Ruminococcus sp.]|nr:DUF4870 domain-containing protein [Ruminococcus sp.]MDE6102423.1 DUF4870 domain-containing protein [Ruminococcus sp.]